MLGEIVDLVRAGGSEPSATMTHMAAADLAAAYLGDEVRIRQILFNLVGNAAKFSRGGHVETQVQVSGGNLVFVVKDDGPGIPKDQIEKIFEAFSQLDGSTTRKYGGTGLGLSISRSLARLMEGDLTLESAPGEGLTATLILPAKPAATVQPVESPVAPAHHTDRALRVMVVDDFEINRELLELGLQRAGHSVSSHGSARSALAALEDGELFDAILMDVQMPEMDGLEATQAIRRLPGAAAEIPVIGLTANILPEQVAECLASGMNEHLGKPVDIDQLIALLRRLPARAPEAPSATPDASPPADPVMERLKSRYVDHLRALPGQLGDALRQDELAVAGKAVAALAHSTAGSAGVFGFPAVSEAAFSLEASAHRAAAGDLERVELASEVQALTAIIEGALAPFAPALH